MKSIKDFLVKKLDEDSPPKTDESGFISPQELHSHLDIQNRGKVDMGDYAAHVMFHCNRPEYLAPYLDKMNESQRRHAMGIELNENDPVLSKMRQSCALTVSDLPPVSESQNHEHPMDPPAVLVMRRKSIRQFPGGKRVALYYIDKLNKYVTVPYEGLEWSGVQEQTVFDIIEEVKKNKHSQIVEHLDGTTSEVTVELANRFINLYKKINESNRRKMLDMLEASSKQFQMVAKFSKD